MLGGRERRRSRPRSTTSGGRRPPDPSRLPGRGRMRAGRKGRQMFDALFWEDVRDVLWSRPVFVLAANAVTLVLAVAAAVHFWSQSYTVAGYLTVQMILLLSQ